MSKKKAITEGLAGLMAAPAATDRKRAAEPQATPAQTPARGNYKTVCYSLPPGSDAGTHLLHHRRRRSGALLGP